MTLHHAPHVTFDPDALHQLGVIFDKVWESIAPNIGKARCDLQVARDDLAVVLIDLAKDGQLGPSQLTRTATRLMRERYLR